MRHLREMISTVNVEKENIHKKNGKHKGTKKQSNKLKKKEYCKLIASQGTVTVRQTLLLYRVRISTANCWTS